MNNERPSWTSRYTFILATIGSAVGLGNIWRFPYIMGQNGGAIFLLVYILLILTICFVPLVSELYFGKMTKKEPIGAYESINKKLGAIGALNPITGILISSFYFVVGGWIIHYICYHNVGIADHSQYFSELIQRPFYSCMLTLYFLFICVFFTSRGVQKGIETINKILMPMFALILIFLVSFSLTLPNANIGLEYMFKPDFSKFNSQMVLSALGQAFFTLSIGMGALMTYGSYLKGDKSITKSAYTIIFADTVFAILAGIMIFPAVFAFGLEPTSGAGLVFVTLPKIFSRLPFGNVVSFLFFVLLFCAAATSGVSILEPPCAALVEKFNISRKKASIILFFVIGIISVFATLSFGVFENIKIFGKTIFDFLDFTTSNILLPVNTLILCLTMGWYCKIKGTTFFKNRFCTLMFDLGLKFIVPISLICLLYAGLR